MSKIRDQGMDLRVFMLRFLICVRGVGLEIRRGFLCFWEMTLF